MSHPAYHVEPIDIVTFAEQILGQEVQPFQKQMLYALQSNVILFVPINSGKRQAMEIYKQYIEWTTNMKVLEMDNGKKT